MTRPDGLTAAAIILRLGMTRHPEGGHFVETFRDPAATLSGRAASTAIYFLLSAGERSHWHRVDASEVWHHYLGAPLELSIHHAGGRQVIRLGSDIMAGEHPQAVVPAHTWQAARSLGDWSLVGCTVAPGFSFAGFELAPPGFDPI